jgi:hypothetical protein
MTYEKPQVVSLDSAVIAIQATHKALAMTPDSKNDPDLVTVNAYESDE